MEYGGKEVNPLIQENFVKNLRNAMESKGMSQADLAKASNLSPASINRYVRGVHVAKSEHLEAIAQTLDTTPRKLLGYEESPNFQNTRYSAHDVTKTLLEQLALLKEKSQSCESMELYYMSIAMAKIAELLPRI